MTNQLHGVKEDFWKTKIPFSKPAYETSVMLTNQQTSIFSTKSRYFQTGITFLEVVFSRSIQVKTTFRAYKTFCQRLEKTKKFSKKLNFPDQMYGNFQVIFQCTTPAPRTCTTPEKEGLHSLCSTLFPLRMWNLGSQSWREEEDWRGAEEDGASHAGNNEAGSSSERRNCQQNKATTCDRACVEEKGQMGNKGRQRGCEEMVTEDFWVVSTWSRVQERCKATGVTLGGRADEETPRCRVAGWYMDANGEMSEERVGCFNDSSKKSGLNWTELFLSCSLISG